MHRSYLRSFRRIALRVAQRKAIGRAGAGSGMGAAAQQIDRPVPILWRKRGKLLVLGMRPLDVLYGMWRVHVALCTVRPACATTCSGV